MHFLQIGQKSTAQSYTMPDFAWVPFLPQPFLLIALPWARIALQARHAMFWGPLPLLSSYSMPASRINEANLIIAPTLCVCTRPPAALVHDPEPDGPDSQA